MSALQWLGPLSICIGIACCQQQADVSWEPLFNDQDLTGWIPKITGYPLGEDPDSTFRVVDGRIIVTYAEYDSFAQRFGHLFYEAPFKHFHLRVDYRFVGEQLAGGPEWALRNSGVMFYSQPPETMGRDQDFPISLEAQFLGGNGSDPRTTMNLCTPGTHVIMGDRLVTDHCVSSSSRTFHLDTWVTAEIIATADEIIHLTQGDTVLRYSQPSIGGGVVAGYDPAYKTDGMALTGGYLALQSESHPIEFRRIEVRRLPD
ncbi:MAG: DUF1080 domain-containing protein [Saprospiraceae bacterium]|nr:DUF1080 domain-containing protein [Saprospiraceae bacterium]